ncbi:GNAT family N-acetyltransferase [Shewanella yunxiaonensis]|uniref:GNAT family N-acetyltransferase n=1 Tax=Shewanella yunxiaonensis TaxID=2829809 RepID=A0ABX7YQU3_9GAMM|nr:GNAT family protein [Shewanella yunxiaonensis]QUN04666.1 GNAT family N-acetyltransferase [Shewanella yunxiaonensis]
MSENLASTSVLEKCGFTQEGLLRHNHKILGEWLDERYYGLLAEEYSSFMQS